MYEAEMNMPGQYSIIKLFMLATCLVLIRFVNRPVNKTKLEKTYYDDTYWY